MGVLKHLSLFSGIGGIDLAAHWAGFTTVQFVEKDLFCQKVLAKNFPGVPIHDDITTFAGQSFRGVDLLSGGFPCQDISNANRNRTGLDGSRSGLFYELYRVVQESRPRFFVIENVRNFLNLGFDVCADLLESENYQIWTFVVPAAGVGAWHKRERVFIVGSDNNSLGSESVFSRTRELHSNEKRNSSQIDGRQKDNEFRGVGSDTSCNVVTDGEEPLERSRGPRSIREVSRFGELSRVFEPKLCGDIHGIPCGLDRLRSLGNAVVPQQVYPILKAIAEVAA